MYGTHRSGAGRHQARETWWTEWRAVIYATTAAFLFIVAFWSLIVAVAQNAE